MAVYACAGIKPAQVEPYLSRGQYLAMAIYSREKLPKKDTFYVTWTDSEGNIQYVPLLSDGQSGPCFVKEFIENKQEIFRIVDAKKGEK